MTMKRKVAYKFRWFRVLIFALAGYFVYCGVMQQAQLQIVYRETEAAKDRLEKANQVNAALNEEKNHLNDTHYIEKLAREDLGLVKPGETPYISVAKQ